MPEYLATGRRPDGRKMTEHEALTLFEPFGDGKVLPSWLYRSLLAQIYEFAQ